MKKAVLRDQTSEVIDALTLSELCRFCGADTHWVLELVEHDVLRPLGTAPDRWVFKGASIVRARKARRLSRDLGINVAGIAMVLDLLEERDRLRRRLSQLELFEE